jgi:hypothetical protein
VVVVWAVVESVLEEGIAAIGAVGRDMGLAGRMMVVAVAVVDMPVVQNAGYIEAAEVAGNRKSDMLGRVRGLYRPQRYSDLGMSAAFVVVVVKGVQNHIWSCRSFVELVEAHLEGVALAAHIGYLCAWIQPVKVVMAERCLALTERGWHSSAGCSSASVEEEEVDVEVVGLNSRVLMVAGLHQEGEAALEAAPELVEAEVAHSVAVVISQEVLWQTHLEVLPKNPRYSTSVYAPMSAHLHVGRGSIPSLTSQNSAHPTRYG